MSPFARLRDPRVSTIVVLVAVLSAGFVTMMLGWSGAAGLGFVAFQMPYIVSGALVGLALVGTALGLLSVHADRVEAAEERRLLAGLQREALRIRAARAEGK